MPESTETKGLRCQDPWTETADAHFSDDDPISVSRGQSGHDATFFLGNQMDHVIEAGAMQGSSFTDCSGRAIGPDLEFDGHIWWRLTDGGQAAIIEMAYRARRGDASAIAVLNGFKIKVMSGNGDRQYWPPK